MWCRAGDPHDDHVVHGLMTVAAEAVGPAWEPVGVTGTQAASEPAACRQPVSVVALRVAARLRESDGRADADLAVRYLGLAATLLARRRCVFHRTALRETHQKVACHLNYYGVVESGKPLMA